MTISARLRIACVATVITVGTALPDLFAQDDGLFDFVPPGGRTLLGQLIDKGALVPEDVLTVKRNAEEWSTYLDGLGEVGLDQLQKDTLSAYLANTMPMGETGHESIMTGAIALPRDGRDLTMEYCQSCHILTVVVTQDRSREAWLGTMNKPSHVEIDTTPSEREAIADYLILNGGISIDDVPEELRAGGATY